MTELLSLLGAVASIAGAFYAFHQAANARTFAQRAESQIANRRIMTDMSRLEERWEATYEALAVFGPGAIHKDIRGKNPSTAARKAQDYLEAVASRRTSLKDIDDLDARLRSMQLLLKNFSGARSGQQMTDAGAKLIAALSGLNAAIISASSLIRERVDVG